MKMAAQKTTTMAMMTAVFISEKFLPARDAARHADSRECERR
jgi:hypothetical protein